MTKDNDIDMDEAFDDLDAPDGEFDDRFDDDFDDERSDDGFDPDRDGDRGDGDRRRGRGRGRGGRGPDGRRPDGRGPGGRGAGRGPKGRGGRTRHRARHGRMGRGDVRTALLIALIDGPGHGYELIKNLEARTEWRWRPSPGSVYPQLQLLADEGLVTSTESGGRRTYELTDAGRAEAEETFESRGVPWRVLEDREGHGSLAKAGRDLHLATKQVLMTGSPEAVASAAEVLNRARREVYQILADS